MNRHLLLLLLPLLTACHSTPPQTALPVAPPAPLPIVELQFRKHTELVELKSDYGYIIDWPQGYSPTFYVFNKPKHTRYKTTNFHRFLMEIDKLPRGIRIDPVDKCTVPFCWGMPQRYRELQALLARKSITEINDIDDEAHALFCYCETKSFQVLADPTEPQASARAVPPSPQKDASPRRR